MSFLDGVHVSPSFPLRIPLAEGGSGSKVLSEMELRTDAVAFGKWLDVEESVGFGAVEEFH